MIYFDNAATTLNKPKSVQDAVYRYMREHGANAGRGGYKEAEYANSVLYHARETLANFFHVDFPEKIVFFPNTTYALNAAILGTVKPMSNVVITSMEHNSVLRPVAAMKKYENISYSVLHANENGEIDFDKLSHLLQPNTSLVCITHASNVCGNVYDIETAAKICHEKNIPILVDCAQTAGVINIDASKFDFVAFPGHKGLMGPMGTGGLIVNTERQLRPFVFGGTGSLSESTQPPDIFPDRLEVGTMNIAGISGLDAAVSFIQKIGVKHIHEHEMHLCKMFETGLRSDSNIQLYGTAPKTAVCAMNIKGIDCEKAARILSDEYNICIRAGLHCAILAHQTLKTDKIGCMRFSFGYFNTEKDVNTALNAVKHLAIKNKL